MVLGKSGLHEISIIMHNVYTLYNIIYNTNDVYAKVQKKIQVSKV